MTEAKDRRRVREVVRSLIALGSYSRAPGDEPYADVADRVMDDPRLIIRLRKAPSEAEIRRAALAMYRMTPQLSMSGAQDLAKAALSAAREDPS